MDILRIIDANRNRATEGLRVVEEVCRFIVEDKQLSLRTKQLRSEIAVLSKGLGSLIEERDAANDVAKSLYTEREGKRKSVADVFTANIKRAQEAVRCLEEFSKLLDPIYGKKFKTIRFKLYDLEKAVVRKLINKDFMSQDEDQVLRLI